MFEPIMLQNLASIASGSIESWISYAPEAVLVGIGAGIFFVLRKRQNFAKEARDRIEFEKIRLGYYNNPQQQNPQPNQNPQQNKVLSMLGNVMHPSGQPNQVQNSAQGNSMPQQPQQGTSEVQSMVSYFAMQKVTELARKHKMSNAQMLDEIVIAYLTNQNQRNNQREAAPRQPPQQGGGQRQNAFAGLDKMSKDLLEGKGGII